MPFEFLSNHLLNYVVFQRFKKLFQIFKAQYMSAELLRKQNKKGCYSVIWVRERSDRRLLVSFDSITETISAFVWTGAQRRRLERSARRYRSSILGKTRASLNHLEGKVLSLPGIPGQQEKWHAVILDPTAEPVDLPFLYCNSITLHRKELSRAAWIQSGKKTAFPQ